MTSFNIIVAIDSQNGIGKNGNLPWHLPSDLKHFKKITVESGGIEKNVVVMGRKTWESIPENFRPLPDRINMVLSRNPELKLPDGVIKAENFDGIAEALEKSKYKNSYGDVFIIGGQQIFEEAIKSPFCHKLYVTHIAQTYDCDVFFPSIPDDFQRVALSERNREGDIDFCFAEYSKISL